LADVFEFAGHYSEVVGSVLREADCDAAAEVAGAAVEGDFAAGVEQDEIGCGEGVGGGDGGGAGRVCGGDCGDGGCRSEDARERDLYRLSAGVP